MPFVLLIVGAILILTAYRNSYGDLATALETDVPGFAKWALALAVVGGLGWVPGMQTISRWLLALVIVAIVLSNKNWQTFFTNVQTISSLPAASTASATPAAAYVASPTTPATQAQISGSSSNTGNINAVAQTATVTSPLGAFDPAAYLTQFEAGIGGFGGIA